MNRLKSYVRRTMLSAARDYAYPAKRRTKESTRLAFIDAMRGTDTGWWHDLIYTAPMLDMARRYRSDIATALDDYRDETGESYFYLERHTSEAVTAEQILSALMRRKALTWQDYSSGPLLDECNAALIGLRFAVEWYANDIAHQYCDDL